MSSVSAESQDVPKAILYSWKTSVWASVPLLCLHEKGYSEDEYVIKQVDISTVPTLVVPTIETVGPETVTRYRSLRDTMTIAQFLDQARGANTTHTTSSLPAPALGPATMEGKISSDAMTSLVHLPTVDPNFLYLAARDLNELSSKANSVAGAYVVDRAEALDRYISEAEQQLQQKGGEFANQDHAKNGSNGTGATSFEARTVQFLKEKKEANDVLYAIYNRQAGKEREQGFFDASTKAWTESLPEVFNKLEQEIKGPYALGDQVSLADLHIISWLARLVQIANGDVSSDAIFAVEKQMGNGHHVGEKIKQFWASWIQRESFRKVWVHVDPEFDEDTQIQAWLNVI
ncbi:hypothetical protein QFC21_000082 [Naganishia friedmannii]|uniref:Uncharacterized protein n=1 Tax=Naganishia friedmannii TaxID=89922 RepID=A0ACC2WCF8_9TREE|nr:hypothetical protein QFC21_000082 [Naganishia friedmannii]